MCYFEGEIVRKIIARGMSQILYESKVSSAGLHIIWVKYIRNAKRTDMLNTTYACIKAFRFCRLEVSCRSCLICAHINRTLDLVIIVLSYKYGLYAKNIQ